MRSPAVAYRTADILAAAREIRAHLDELVGEHASEVLARLNGLIADADRDPEARTRILALLSRYPRAYQWLIDQLDQAASRRGEAAPGAGPGDSEEYGWDQPEATRGAQPEVPRSPRRQVERLEEPPPPPEPPSGPGWAPAQEQAAAPEPLELAAADAPPEPEGPAAAAEPLELAAADAPPEPEGPAAAAEPLELAAADPRPVPSEMPAAYGPSPGLLGDEADDAGAGSYGGGDGEISPAPGDTAKQAEQRFFLAELEDHPKGEPLRKDDQYTIAFSVGPSTLTAIAQQLFPDETLAAADPGIEVFELTVQLDSDDFEILGDSTRPLRVRRTGRSLGKARFEIAPRRDGDCRLAASVHFQGNFIHQMKLTIPVGGREAAVTISARGRPPDSAAALEPRDISILLEPAPGGGFSCTALGSVGGRTILPITTTELAAAVDAARRAMMSVISSVSAGERIFQTRIDIPGDAREAALRTLARAGSRLFQQLFLHPAAGADARRIGEWLRGYAMDPDLRLTVQIFADHAPLPWAMLYLGDAAEGARLNWDNFLGMRHIVEQLPLQMSLDTIDNEILSTPRLAVSVNVNATIDPLMGITLVAGHQKYWRDTAAARAGLTLLSRSTRSEVVRALADGHTGDQVVYFYCHATAGGQNNQDPDAAAIIMGQNDAATVADLNLDAPTTTKLAGNPLVFINACESAELSPLFYNGFVPYFMAKGARGVIGTECKTPVLFAIEWANAFFDQFLDGAAVGETVLKLRQDFLRGHGNPLGLIYAVHCDADTRIAPALARARRKET
jgi:hypothetical protein